MKKTTKRVFGGLMIAMLIATIGAIVVSANTDFFANLTEEQRQEIRDYKNNLIEQGYTKEEIHEAMKEKFEEYGIELPTREEMLDKKIEHTEQKLEILYRIKELIEENPEITEEEIKEIIEEEFDIELPEDGSGKMKGHRGLRGARGPQGCMPSGEELE